MTDALIKNVERALDDIIQRERDYAPWMAQVIIAISKDPGYNKLTPHLREEIETIVAAIE